MLGGRPRGRADRERAADWRRRQALKVAADVNAVPPAGIEGLGAQDDGVSAEGHGAVGIGALAIGGVKYKVQAGLFRRMIEAEKPLYPRFPRRLRAGARNRWLSRDISGGRVVGARAGRRRASAPATASSAIDLFGDTDMRAGAEDSVVAEGISTTASMRMRCWRRRRGWRRRHRSAPFGFVYGSGLEAQPELLARLAAGRRLFGNAPATVARLEESAGVLRASSIGSACPIRRFACRRRPIRGLADEADRRLRRRPCRAGARRRGAQRRLLFPAPRGRPAGRRLVPRRRPPGASLLGFSEQWTDSGEPLQPYRFGGVLQPAAIERSSASRCIPRLLDALVTRARPGRAQQPRSHRRRRRTLRSWK